LEEWDTLAVDVRAKMLKESNNQAVEAGTKRSEEGELGARSWRNS